VFNIKYGQSPTLAAAWDIGSNKLLVQTGGTFTSGGASTLNPTIGTLQLQSSATYVKKNTSYSNIGAFSLDAISTFQLDDNANLESPVLLTVTWFSTARPPRPCQPART